MPQRFSLIIPTFNRKSLLLDTLARLDRLRYPRERYEVIVVDDGCTDGTSEALSQLSPSYELRRLRQPRSGASAARNIAIREARGSHLLFLDDDVICHPDFLAAHHEGHRGQLKRLVRGPIIDIRRLPEPQNPGPLWFRFSMNFFCTGNSSIERELMLQAGPFDESLSRWEDAELGWRLKRLGVKRKFVPRAYVHHLKPPLPYEQAATTKRADGESAARLLRRYPGLRMRLRTGLHAINYLRCQLLTESPLARLLERTSQFRPLVESQRLDREYLWAGRKELTRT